MKNLIFIALLFSSAITFGAEEITVTVKGMVCAFCAQGIEKHFKEQKEVDTVDVSLANKYVKLKFKEGMKLPNDKIVEILKDAGYETSFGDQK
jgi:periplasmic mercuric ion binding protein